MGPFGHMGPNQNNFLLILSQSIRNFRTRISMKKVYCLLPPPGALTLVRLWCWGRTLNWKANILRLNGLSRPLSTVREQPVKILCLPHFVCRTSRYIYALCSWLWEKRRVHNSKKFAEMLTRVCWNVCTYNLNESAIRLDLQYLTWATGYIGKYCNSAIAKHHHVTCEKISMKNRILGE